MSSRTKPIQALLQSQRTVWNSHDLRVLWGITSNKKLSDTIRYYTTTGQLMRLRRGIYALTEEYNVFELAQKLQTPSYISLDTALRKQGIIQQYSEEITCIGTYPRSYIVNTTVYRYHQMDTALLACPTGIQQTKTYAIAVPERALIDSLYFGFQPDVSTYTNWNTSLLQQLLLEFTMPRIAQGLQMYQLSL